VPGGALVNISLTSLPVLHHGEEVKKEKQKVIMGITTNGNNECYKCVLDLNSEKL